MPCIKKYSANLTAVVLTALTMGCANVADVQSNSEPVIIGQRYSLASTILDEEREYLVYLPLSYNDAKYSPRTYPVLYLLDGGPLFPSAAVVVQYMSSNINGNDQIPELIVVAIPNTNRMRDLTPTRSLFDADGNEQPVYGESGGGDKFLRFIRDELFPEIDATYRTTPHRTIVGNSLGGLLALHSMFATPELFQAYIANDPSLWWDKQFVIREAQNALALDRRNSHSVYISSAHSIDGRMTEVAREMAEMLSSEGAKNIRVSYQHFDFEDHGSLYLPGLYYGLRHVFEGYDLSFDDFFDNPKMLVPHFQKLSMRLGVDILPPESLIDSWGQFALHSLNNPDKALEFFQVNALSYPQSANVYVSLGDAYAEMGESTLAIKNLEKALEIDPHHYWVKWTRQTLSELRE
jgi:predicted alpha/beta superfamily hydrolase